MVKEPEPTKENEQILAIPAQRHSPGLVRFDDQVDTQVIVLQYLGPFPDLS